MKRHYYISDNLDDLDRIEGNREQLEGVIQARYGKTKEEAKEAVENFMNS